MLECMLECIRLCVSRLNAGMYECKYASSIKTLNLYSVSVHFA